MWSKLPTPVAGSLGGYVLAPATGVTSGPGPFEQAIDGTLYAAWNVTEGAAGANLYKSSDGGRTWAQCSNAIDDLGDVTITGISLSPQDASRLYVTDGTSIYRSSDAGANFVKLVDPPGAIDAIEAVYSTDHFIYVAVDGGVACDEIYLMRDAFGYTWSSTSFVAAALASTTPLANPIRDVIEIVASPNFSTESLPMVVAINNDGTGTLATFSYGGAAWAAPVPGGDDMFISNTVLATVADVAFPADFNSTRGTRDFFIGLADLAAIGTDGDAYRLISTNIVDLNVRGGTATAITSVAVAGNSSAGKLLATGSSVRDVFHSEDNGLTWTQSDPAGVYSNLLKDPVDDTGTTAKYIVMASDYYTSGKAWVAVSTSAAASWDNASVTQTMDFGATWNDLSMINDSIGQIHNMEVSPAYASDSTVFMLTTGNGAVASLWRWDGTYWTRIGVMPFASAAATMVKASPDYKIDRAIFLIDTATNIIYRSTDNGMRFAAQVSSPGAINGGVLIVNANTLLAGVGQTVKISRNNGTSWDTVTIATLGNLFSFAKSPAYSSDKTLLLGTTNGMVFISRDDGVTWTQVPVGGTAGTGCVNVAFDSGYAMNNYVIAADAGGNRIYRINAATGTSWSTISSGLAGSINASTLVPGIQMSGDGTLYVSSPTTAGSSGTTSAADSFILYDPAGGDSGSINVVSGTVTVTPNGGVAVTVGASGPESYPYGPTAAGDYFTVVCTAGPASGTWTQTTGTAAAAIVSDIDGDASVSATAGTWSLPDTIATSGASMGSTQLVLRSLSGTRTFFEPLSFGFFFPSVAANAKGVWYTDGMPPGAPNIWLLESAAGNSNIWTYTDQLTKAGTLASPADKTSTGRVTTATLVWNRLNTASVYEVQISLNSFFTAMVAGSPAYSFATSYTVTGLEDGTTYYWRVRSAPNTNTPPNAGKASSPWSSVWSFTTGIAGAEWTPFDNAGNVAPAPGAQGVSLRPGFQWNPADWATGYEFALDDNADFSSPIKSFTGDSALATTAYALDEDLSYNTTYVWRVRAVSATSESIYGVGTFTTMAQPTTAPPPVTVTQQPQVTLTIPPAEPATEITPAWIWAIVIIGGVLVIAVIVLIVTTRRVP